MGTFLSKGFSGDPTMSPEGSAVKPIIPDSLHLKSGTQDPELLFTLLSSLRGVSDGLMIGLTILKPLQLMCLVHGVFLGQCMLSDIVHKEQKRRTRL